VTPQSFGEGGLTAGGGRLSGVNVADNDHVDVHLLLTMDIVSDAVLGVGVATWSWSDAPYGEPRSPRRGNMTYPMLAVLWLFVYVW